MNWKPRPRNSEAKLSPAQEQAIARNFRIFRLRGLYFHAWLLSGKRRERMKALVDAELKAMGAEPQTERVLRQQRDRQSEFHRDMIITKLLKGIPIV